MKLYTYTEIFNDIVSIMRTDSATCKDMGAGSFEKYRAEINDSMPRREFVRLVKAYISEFKLPGHLQFTDNTMGTIDYEIIRYKDALIVTKADHKSALKKGDRIIKVDSLPIDEVAEKNKVFLMDEPIERQSFLWWQILMFSKTVTVLRNVDEQMEIPTVLSLKPEYSEEKYYYRVSEDEIYIRLADFNEEGKIRELFEKVFIYLDECRNLTIDLKGNCGGSDAVLESFIPYCFPEGEHRIDDNITEINYTRRNCESRLRIFDRFFSGDISPELKEAISVAKEEIISNAGKGFVRNEAQIRIISGKSYPKKIKVYTDECCCSAGEAFVEMLSKSPKVTIIGRPTMGIQDYSNCTNAVWDDFYLEYPTSRDCRIDRGEGTLGKGVPVDEYVPYILD